MIAGLSKAVVLYLAPLLTLTTIVLSVIVFLSPVIILHDQVALLTVTPLKGLDGPSVFLGLLGSCSRLSNSAPLNCTAPTISPVFDVSALPENAPSRLLSAPAASTPAFIAIAIAFSMSFFITFTLVSFRHKMGSRIGGAFEKPLFQHLSAWIGFFGFLIGLTSFLIVRMWFGKAVQDFNDSIEFQRSQAPKLVAAEGNAFTMMWVAYAFYAVPIIVSLAKLNVKASK
ncbi:hypothetical protein Hypma_015489 [Hypsizygus marmoreus]|uniref:Uncharacterized protein n=1 Tax=Hypsizygus marmoreus TaxID=39966 RepID=A0A369K2E0_HYPMA|nr:hypothetical protein Hypma_015489 [Hypsizygus marmoreus]